MNAASTDAGLDAYDLDLRCEGCGVPLRCYEDYDPEMGTFLVYAANDRDATQSRHSHDRVIVRVFGEVIETSPSRGTCRS